MCGKRTVLARSSDPVRFEVRLQRFGNEDASVRLLPGFDEGDKEASQGGAAPIENMGQDVLTRGILEPKIHAAGLKIFAVGAAGYLQIFPLPWRPDFDIEGFGAGKSHVARPTRVHRRMKAQRFE